MGAYNDSLNKIFEVYFKSFCTKEFEYTLNKKTKVIQPLKLKVMPSLLRDVSCPEFCGACCYKYTLDYIEKPDLEVTERLVNVSGKDFKVFSELQTDNPRYHCKYLSPENGRCLIHTKRHLVCDFELIRLMMYEDHVWLTTRLYGRGWNMLKYTCESRGAHCTIPPADDNAINDIVRRLKRLKSFMSYFELETDKLDKVIDIVDSRYLQRSGAPFTLL